MKMVGVIGGLGPETSAKLYLQIVETCFKKNNVTRPPILLWNVPIPYRMESNLILKNQGANKFLPFLVDAARNLQKAGADFLILPCNSMHIFIEDIRNSVDIPVISIVEEVAKLLNKQNILSVGILATSTTLTSQLFQNALRSRGVKISTPTKSDQIKLGVVINNILQKKQTLQNLQTLKQIISRLETENIILACTDLQLMVKNCHNVKIIDTLEVLKNATIRKMLS